MSAPISFDRLLISRPRESLFLLCMVITLIWQTPVMLASLCLFFIFVKLLRINWKFLLPIGVLSLWATFLYVILYRFSWFSFKSVFSYGFLLNENLWKIFVLGHVQHFSLYLLRQDKFYLLAFTPVIVAVFSLIDIVPNSVHEKKMREIHRGVLDTNKEKHPKFIEKALDALPEVISEGTILGVSKMTGKPVILTDKQLNQVTLVLGTTGAGKTITLRRFYHRAISQGYPLIIVDGKPTDENIEWIQNQCNKFGRQFYGFNGGNFYHYNPLACGGYTELKDKIMCLKDEWENDYYKSIAEDYLQTVFEVLIKSGQAFDLKKVIDCLDFGNLALMVRELKNEELMDRVRHLENYDKKDIAGLQAHLNILINSELGKFFQKCDSIFNLEDVIKSDAIVYFALPALRFPSFAKVLGKLVINDIKTMIDRNSLSKKIFTIFDEFSVFAGDQVLNLVNMGRGKGVHAIFGTQGLADLEEVTKSFSMQILNCVNTIICHRVNDHASAESLSSWIGTRETFDLTAQVNIREGATGMGSVNKNKEFIIHPDSIKQGLSSGEAFYCSKINFLIADKVKIKYS